MTETQQTQFVPAGHFYSPYANSEDTARASKIALREAPQNLPGINLNDDEMQSVWEKMLPHMSSLDFPDTPGDGAYHYLNDMYSYGDADVYAGMIALHRPRRIIEIGSGYSSALSVEMRDNLGLDTRISFIEPYPENLKHVWGEHNWSNVDLIERMVQDVPLSLFDELSAGDILFVDSSHVVKAGSDVCHEVFRILPRVKPGVVVHFHDCFWPFEYPDHWNSGDQRNWTELYLLRAFLMYNNAFKILFFNQYFAYKHKARAAIDHPRFIQNAGGGLWLQRQG